MTEQVNTLIFYTANEGGALLPLKLPFGIKAIVRRLNKARAKTKDNRNCNPEGFGVGLCAVYLPDSRAWDVVNGFRKYGDPKYYQKVYDLLSQAHLQEAYENLKDGDSEPDNRDSD